MHNGFAIALAWPETLCKMAGAWYDTPLKWLGINQDNYYRVGHSAVVLIENKTGDCHYFDFGRYHAPYQHGRVRNSYTDHELEIKTNATILENKLINYEEILWELFKNESCHGTGRLEASYCQINFDSALQQAKKMQRASPIKYGPFTLGGTNCSRFVNTIILAGKPKISHQLLLAFPISISPTPLGNTNALNPKTKFRLTHMPENSSISNQQF